MRKDTVQNRLNHMERQVNGALEMVAKRHDEIEESLNTDIEKAKEDWELTDERLTKLREEYDERMRATADYYAMPWWWRLVTRGPR